MNKNTQSLLQAFYSGRAPTPEEEEEERRIKEEQTMYIRELQEREKEEKKLSLDNALKSIKQMDVTRRGDITIASMLNYAGKTLKDPRTGKITNVPGKDIIKEKSCNNGIIILLILFWKDLDNYFYNNEYYLPYNSNVFTDNKIIGYIKNIQLINRRDNTEQLLNDNIDIVQHILQMASELNCDITSIRIPKRDGGFELSYIVPKGEFENLIYDTRLDLTRGERYKLKCLRLASEGEHMCKAPFGFGGKTKRKRRQQKSRKLRKSRRRR
jgi:DNA-binding MltR family transcriptional regulator